MSDVTVRLQALDGAWETCGADRARGVWPENVELTSDRWGPKTASFDLKRDPKSTWPDLGAFTPVEIEVDGVLRWSGRVAQTPVRDDLDSVISVQCEGWQAHLDDDLYERAYVHTRLSDWKDQRSFLTADLTKCKAAWQVTQDHGLTIMLPQAAVQAANDMGCVTLDLGPGGSGKRVVLTYDWKNVSGIAFDLRVDGGDAEAQASAAETSVIAAALADGGSGSAVTASGTFTTARRYVHIRLASGYAATLTGDVWVRITSVQVFADTAYESGGASVLKSDVVVEDALQQATILLDSDRSLIDAGTFNIPEFSMSAPRTPRQTWEAVDAFEDRMKKIDVRRRPVYTAKPSTPEVEVGAFTAMSFEDSAANDGGEVYSRVTVAGEQPDGTPLRVTREQAQQPGVQTSLIAAPAAANPSFDTNTTGWTATGSTITRDTGTYDSSPAAGRWDNTGAADNLSVGDQLSASFTGTFRAGVPYVLSFRIRASAAISLGVHARFGDVTAGDNVFQSLELAATTWTTVMLSWTPTAHRTSVVFDLTHMASGRYYHVDSLSLASAAPTIVDRRGFRRSKTLDVGFALTQSAAQQIADKWLVSHQRTPSKGTLKLTGPARHILTGQPVQPEALLDRTDHLIRLSDRIDPDTGAVGRDVRIAEVSVRPETREATVQLDSTRGGFDALLARLDVVLGQGAR